MAKLLVSFDIKFEDEHSYNEIYDNLIAAIKKSIGGSRKYWSDTTSFYVIDASESAAQFTQRIAAEGGLRRTKDKLLVLDADVKAGAFWGQTDDQDLFVILPFIQKL